MVFLRGRWRDTREFVQRRLQAATGAFHPGGAVWHSLEGRIGLIRLVRDEAFGAANAESRRFGSVDLDNARPVMRSASNVTHLQVSDQYTICRGHLAIRKLKEVGVGGGWIRKVNREKGSAKTQARRCATS